MVGFSTRAGTVGSVEKTVPRLSTEKKPKPKTVSKNASIQWLIFHRYPPFTYIQANSIKMTAHLYLYFFLWSTYLFSLPNLKFYPIRLFFIYSTYLNFNPGEHPKASINTTYKGPNIAPLKFHDSLWRPFILPKTL